MTDIATLHAAWVKAVNAPIGEYNPDAVVKAHQAFAAELVHLYDNDKLQQVELAGYMRAEENDGNSFWVSKGESAYYTVPVYRKKALSDD